MTRRVHRAVPGAVSILMLLVLVAPAGRGAAHAQRAVVPEGMTGQVVDASGTGVEAAKVWVVGGSWEQPEAVAEATTDAQGHFAFPEIGREEGDDAGRKPRAHSYALAARDGEGRIGWVTSVYRGNTAAITIELAPRSEGRGRLVDTDGKPISGAEVAPVLFARSSEAKSAVDYARLTPDLARPFATTTEEDGSFLLTGIPQGCKVQARLTTRGFGTPRVSWDSTRPVEITLDGRLGRIEGKLVAPEAQGPLPRVALSLRRASAPSDHAGRGFDLLEFQTVESDDDGRFRFDGLAPGRYAIAAQEAAKVGYAAEPIAEVEVNPDATITDLEVSLKQLATITGRILDADSGEGVPGVGVTASSRSGHSLQQADSDETDAQGRYSVHVMPGTNVLVQPSSVPKSHLGLDTESCHHLDVETDREWPDIRLARAMTLDGIVVDAAGKPVEGARIELVTPSPMGFAGGVPPRRTGADGTFRLDQIDPDDTLPVRARTGEATTDGALVIRPGRHEGTLSLTIDPKFASHVRGTVADAAGKPIAGAGVQLWWGRSYVSEKTRFSGIGSVLETLATDDEGRFSSSALWPGDRYKVVVEGKGYGKAETPEVAGRAGEVHDLGTIRLVGTGASIAGRIVDTDGKPIAGATVFNRGDAPEAVSTPSAQDGGFRLDGLFAGGAYVFVRKDRYRFTGVRVEEDAEAPTITLRRLDEPPSAWTPKAVGTDEEDRALAKRLLTKLWDRHGKQANKNGAFVCILQMARIDPTLARTWSAELGGRYDGRILQEAATVLAETDADAALELLTAPEAGTPQYTLQTLAEQFADENPASALKFAEEAAVKARAMEQPDRAGAMARTGALLARLGRREAGLALVNEAADAAARMGLEGRQSYARGNVAAGLAPFDAERALALVEPMKDEDDRTRYLGFIASALAGTDPERALAVAGQLGDRSSTKQSVKVEIAHALGRAGRTDDAVKVIDGMTGYAAVKYQSQAYAWLAVAIAPKDQARAAHLLDLALALPVDHPEEFESWTYFGGGAGEAAWSAACARRAGYPDMAGAVASVLASRPSSRHRDPAMEAQSQAIAAAILALTDPEAARRMLLDLEARSGLAASDVGKITDRRFLTAWAQADPQHAEALFDAQLAALDGQRDPDLQQTGLLKMTEILSQPRHRREAYLRQQISATWYPGIEP